MFEDLKELKNLLDEGVITEDDYNRKKEELLFGQKKPVSPKVKEYEEEYIEEDEEEYIEEDEEEYIKKEKTGFSLSNYRRPITITITALLFFLFSMFSGTMVEEVEWMNYDRYSMIVSPLLVNDARAILYIIAIIFVSICTILSFVSIWVKNEKFNIIKHLFTILTIAMSMVSGIFNVTYGSDYVHPCAVISIIVSVLLLIFEAIIILKPVLNYLKNILFDENY